jgi:hypothetical protein
LAKVVPYPSPVVELSFVEIEFVNNTEKKVFSAYWIKRGIMYTRNWIINGFYSAGMFVDGNHNLFSCSKHTAVSASQTDLYDLIESLGISVVAGD